MEKLGLYYVATERSRREGGNGGAFEANASNNDNAPAFSSFLLTTTTTTTRPVRRILFPDKCNVRAITSRKNHIFCPYFMEAAAVFLAHSLANRIWPALQL